VMGDGCCTMLGSCNGVADCTKLILCTILRIAYLFGAANDPFGCCSHNKEEDRTTSGVLCMCHNEEKYFGEKVLSYQSFYRQFH
jgi:hypothetical protein